MADPNIFDALLIRANDTGLAPRRLFNPLRGILISLALGASMTLAAGMAHAESKSGQDFKDWRMKCEVQEGSEEERCYIVQGLVTKEGGRQILNVAVGYLAKTEQPAAIITLPLGISLPQGVSLQVDEGESTRFPVERCNQTGCLAGIALDEERLTAFRNGLEARVTFYDGARQPVTVPVSLKGFTAGFDAIR